jgi:hypothetical protein
VTKFSVIAISAEALIGAEVVEGGAAEKYRLDVPEVGTVILKNDDESLNGAWVEKITSELAALVGIPAAIYEFAELPGEIKAIISPNYLLPGHFEQSGKMLLGQHFGQREYSYMIEAVLATIDTNDIMLPSGFVLPESIMTAADLLAGYLIFDYWVDNIDRHYENWGIQIDVVTGNKELLPTYDHGLSLGFLLFDEECLGLSPANHVQNQSSAFSGGRGRSVSMNEMLAEVVSLRPGAAKVWIERIAGVGKDVVVGLFDHLWCKRSYRIPDGWVSAEKQQFAISLLDFNRQQLVSVCNELNLSQ